MCRVRFLDTGSSRVKTDSPARTWSHPHPPAHTRTRPRAHARLDGRRRPPRPFDVGIFERLAFSTFQIFIQKFLDIYEKGNTKENTKNESEYRAQQERGSNARYHRHVLMRLRSAFSVPGSEVSFFCVESFYFSDFRFPPGHADVTDTTTPADGTRRMAVFLSLW